MNKEELQAIQTMMEQVMDNKLQPVHEQLKAIREDVDILKDETAITRHTTNLLLKWAEKADRTAVNVGLYDTEDNNQ